LLMDFFLSFNLIRFRLGRKSWSDTVSRKIKNLRRQFDSI
jgi:hypothetical protein